MQRERLGVRELPAQTALWRLVWCEQRVTDMIPAEREGATHRLPMPSDGLVAVSGEKRPAQGVFDVFVALFDPHP
jgi:hypothetical protein